MPAPGVVRQVDVAAGAQPAQLAGDAKLSNEKPSLENPKGNVCTGGVQQVDIAAEAQPAQVAGDAGARRRGRHLAPQQPVD